LARRSGWAGGRRRNKRGKNIRENRQIDANSEKTNLSDRVSPTKGTDACCQGKVNPRFLIQGKKTAGISRHCLYQLEKKTPQTPESIIAIHHYL